MENRGDDYSATDDDFLKRLSVLFIFFSLVCILAGASRLSSCVWNLQRVADVLRVRELLSMFVFAPLISIFFWLFHRTLSRGRTSLVMDVICILSIWAIACGMGIHDPVNCLEYTYRSELASSGALHKSVVYIDDQLGHWVFWCGFVMGTWCVGISQLISPLKQRMNLRWMAVFAVVTLALMGVMLTNLWDEYPKTRGDLIVIGCAVCALIPAHLLLARRVSVMRLPFLFVIYFAYFGSVIGTLICWQIRYGVFF